MFKIQKTTFSGDLDKPKIDLTVADDPDLEKATASVVISLTLEPKGRSRVLEKLQLDALDQAQDLLAQLGRELLQRIQR